MMDAIEIACISQASLVWQELQFLPQYAMRFVEMVEDTIMLAMMGIL